MYQHRHALPYIFVWYDAVVQFDKVPRLLGHVHLHIRRNMYRAQAVMITQVVMCYQLTILACANSLLTALSITRYRCFMGYYDVCVHTI